MTKVVKEGYTIAICLPETNGHEGYSVRCTYRYVKNEGKYLLSMWLIRNDIGEAQEIDTQYISGDMETIEENIVRIVEQGALSGYFDRYIERFEYTCRCFDMGNELFEQEELDKGGAA